MAQTEGELRRLAEQALDETGLCSQLALDQDPDGAWVVWMGGFGVHVSADDPAVTVLARFVDAICEYGSESAVRWGVAMPACPGHRHPATVDDDGSAVVLSCPAGAGVVRRIVPR